FHEVKKFVHSGLAEKLSAEYELIFLVLGEERLVVKELFGTLGKVIFISDYKQSTNRTFQEVLARASSEAWMRNRGIPLHHNYKRLPEKKKWDWILGLSLLKRTLAYLALNKVRRTYLNNYIKEILIENRITHVM